VFPGGVQDIAVPHRCLSAAQCNLDEQRDRCHTKAVQEDESPMELLPNAAGMMGLVFLGRSEIRR
jgi:hypothetical protein